MLFCWEYFSSFNSYLIKLMNMKEVERISINGFKLSRIHSSATKKKYGRIILRGLFLEHNSLVDFLDFFFFSYVLLFSLIYLFIYYWFLYFFSLTLLFTSWVQHTYWFPFYEYQKWFASTVSSPLLRSDIRFLIPRKSIIHRMWCTIIDDISEFEKNSSDSEFCL